VAQGEARPTFDRASPRASWKKSKKTPAVLEEADEARRAAVRVIPNRRSRRGTKKILARELAELEATLPLPPPTRWPSAPEEDADTAVEDDDHCGRRNHREDVVRDYRSRLSKDEHRNGRQSPKPKRAKNAASVAACQRSDADTDRT